SQSPRKTLLLLFCFHRFSNKVAFLFLNSRCLTGETTEIIKFCTAYVTAACHYNAFHARGIERENTFNAFAVAEFAHGESRIEACVFTGNAYAFECLNTLIFAFNDLYVDDNGIASLEIRYGLTLRKFRGVFLFKFLQAVHSNPHQ